MKNGRYHQLLLVIVLLDIVTVQLSSYDEI